MKLVFLSNFFNHHQKPLSDALYRLTDAFCFIETEEIPQERVKMGYAFDARPAYVASFFRQEERTHCEQALANADVVVFGSAPEVLFRQCHREGRLLFRYSERPLKNGAEPLKVLPRLVRWHWRNPPCARIYLLCASAYTASDYAKYGLFCGRAFKWGYFPPTQQYDTAEALLSKKNPLRILWAGRFLQWKHPDDAILVASQLKDAGYRFSMDLIGAGVMEPILQKMILQLNLSDCVHMLGVKTPEEVRRHMEKAGVFLMTSDRYEGWGAVVNEAMNSGCAVLASDAAGATPYLIRDGENGLIYHSGDVRELEDKLAQLLMNPPYAKQLGVDAYETISTLWNAEVAAERLIRLSETILSGDRYPDLFREGPCSRA